MSNTPRESNDPFSLPTNTTVNEGSRIKIEALVSPATLAELRKLRGRAGVRPQHTQAWLGSFLDQLLAVASKTPDASAKTIMGGLKERGVMKKIRHALGEAMIVGKTVSGRELALEMGVSLTPYFLGALNDLGRAGLAESALIRRLEDKGATPRRWKLTPEGMKLTASDHDSEEVRFTLAGLQDSEPPAKREDVIAESRAIVRQIVSSEDETRARGPYQCKGCGAYIDLPGACEECSKIPSESTASVIEIPGMEGVFMHMGNGSTTPAKAEHVGGGQYALQPGQLVKLDPETNTLKPATVACSLRADIDGVPHFCHLQNGHEGDHRDHLKSWPRMTSEEGLKAAAQYAADAAHYDRVNKEAAAKESWLDVAKKIAEQQRPTCVYCEKEHLPE